MHEIDIEAAREQAEEAAQRFVGYMLDIGRPADGSVQVTLLNTRYRVSVETIPEANERTLDCLSCGKVKRINDMSDADTCSDCRAKSST